MNETRQEAQEKRQAGKMGKTIEKESTKAATLKFYLSLFFLYYQQQDFQVLCNAAECLRIFSPRSRQSIRDADEIAGKFI